LTRLSNETKGTSQPKPLLWRRINKRSAWERNSGLSDSEVTSAATDFRLRNGEEYLSFFEVADEDEGRRVAAVYRIVRDERPDKIDFVVFSRHLLAAAGIEVEPKRDDHLPPFLASRHLGTVGPIHEPSEAVIRSLLTDGSTRVVRLRVREIEELVAQFIRETPCLVEHIGEHWRRQLATSGILDDTREGHPPGAVSR
jgi:hypothetical protein